MQSPCGCASGASAPYVRARWAPGLHVADGDTDPDRYEQADALWNSLRANEAGARTMASVLYGDAPRCLAYLDPTIRKSAPSLLSQQLRQYDAGAHRRIADWPDRP